jgi:hypothetical protein
MYQSSTYSVDLLVLPHCLVQAEARAVSLDAPEGLSRPAYLINLVFLSLYTKY